MRRPTLLAVAVLLAGCGGSDDEPAPTPTPSLAQSGPETGHVHAVGLDPEDGSIVVAAHTGLFRAEPGADRATRLGDERRDVMGFTVEGPGRFVGSGHPDLRDIEAGAPTSVGFIRSFDGGRNWKTISLEGAADLHVLEVAPGRIYGYDAISGRFLASRDGGRSWKRSTVEPIIDIAVDPDDPDVVVASGERGLLRSKDGGATFAALDRTPASQLVWGPKGLLRLGYDGVVRTAARLGDEPQNVAKMPVLPGAASLTADGEVLVAGDDGSVAVSQDGGLTWQPRLGPGV